MLRGDFESNRGWHYAAGATTGLAAAYVLRDLNERIGAGPGDSDPSELTVFEGFFSHKSQSDKSDRAKDAASLLDAFLEGKDLSKDDRRKGTPLSLLTVLGLCEDPAAPRVLVASKPPQGAP